MQNTKRCKDNKAVQNKYKQPLALGLDLGLAFTFPSDSRGLKRCSQEGSSIEKYYLL